MLWIRRLIVSLCIEKCWTRPVKTSFKEVFLLGEGGRGQKNQKMAICGIGRKFKHKTNPVPVEVWGSALGQSERSIWRPSHLITLIKIYWVAWVRHVFLLILISWIWGRFNGSTSHNIELFGTTVGFEAYMYNYCVLWYSVTL